MSEQKIIISCDTTISKSKEEIEKLGLHVIPLNAIADGVEYHDTVDIDADKLCELMHGGAKVHTSTPTIGEIENYFDKLFLETKADKIIHFTISSKLSSMFSLFTTVCKEKYGEKVIVVDSLSVCVFMANQVLYAKKLAEEGYGVEEILDKVNQIKDTEQVVFVPETLLYLKNGGRISPAIAAIAGLIGVLPILTFRHGEVGKEGVTRTIKKAFTSAFGRWEKEIPTLKKDYSLVIITTSALDEDKIQKTKDILKMLDVNMDLVCTTLSLNVTAHAGPGTVGLGIMKKYKM